MEIKTTADREKTATLQLLWDRGRKDLLQAGVPESDLDARLLLLEAFQIDMAHFLIRRMEQLDMDDPQVKAAADQYEAWISKRRERVPLQHLTGRQEFMGLDFFVNEHVLIPRQDTEILVELVMRRRPAKEGERLLDMCAGSGCIGVSLAALGSYGDVTEADISLPALETAWKNGRHCLEAAGKKTNILEEKPGSGNRWERALCWRSENGVKGCGKMTFVQSDLFQNLDKSLKYDIIVSNPPYIPSKVIEGLEPEVRDHEPRMALDGTEDGLRFYRCLAKESRDYLPAGGELFLEIGYDQGEAVKELLKENGFSDIEVVKDHAGLDRVVHGVFRG